MASVRTLLGAYTKYRRQGSFAASSSELEERRGYAQRLATKTMESLQDREAVQAYFMELRMGGLANTVHYTCLLKRVRRTVGNSYLATTQRARARRPRYFVCVHSQPSRYDMHRLRC
jgi:hypothetical protein